MKALYTKYKNYILGAGLLLAIMYGYFTFFAPSGNDPLLVSQKAPEADVSEGLLRLLLQLKALDLDDSILSRPSFNSLKDFSQELIPEPVGRTNPFAPLGTASAQSTTE